MKTIFFLTAAGIFAFFQVHPILASTTEATAYVVDFRPALGPNEFLELQEAIDAVCASPVPGAEAIEREVIIRKRGPIEVEDLQLPCGVKIRSEEGKAHLKARSSMIRVHADAPADLSGLASAGALQVLAKSDLVLSDSELSLGIIILDGTAHHVAVRDNRIGSLEVTIKQDYDSLRLDLSGNSRLGTGTNSKRGFDKESGGQGSKLLVRTAKSLAGELILDRSTLDSIEAELPALRGDLDVSLDDSVVGLTKMVACGARSGIFSLDRTTIEDLRIDIAYSKGELKTSGGRLGNVIVDTAECVGIGRQMANLIATFRNKVVESLSFLDTQGIGVSVKIRPHDLEVGNLEVNYETPGLSLLLGGSVLKARKLDWKTYVSADIEVDDINIRGKAIIESGGPLKTRIGNLDVGGGLYLGVLPKKDGINLETSVEWTQRGGRFGGTFDMVIPHVGGRFQAKIFGTTFDPGSGITMDRMDPDDFDGLGGNFPFPWKALGGTEGELVIEQGIFKGGAYIWVKDVDIPVRIVNNEIEVPARGAEGVKGIIAEFLSGPVVIQDNVLSSSTCTMGCIGMELTRIDNLQLLGNKFFLNGGIMAAALMVTSIAKLEAVGNEFRSSQGMQINISNESDYPTFARFTGNQFDWAGIMIGAESFVRMTGNTFGGESSIFDVPGISNTELGGLLNNPVTANSGLKENKVSSLIDWDGNGCADIPAKSNERGTDGECKSEGLPPPRARN